jgi:hypothetical protein
MADRLPHVAGHRYDGLHRRFEIELSNGERETVAAHSRPYDPFQVRVMEWMAVAFGSYIIKDAIERRDRFGEEALELVQACGATKAEAHALVDYVFGREIGQVEQEVGGVMVTLAALCGAREIDMHQCGDVELDRVWGPDIINKIRTKQRGKPDFGPLPTGPNEPVWSTEAALRNILASLDARPGESVVLSRDAIAALLNPGADSFTVAWQVDPELTASAVTPASIATDVLELTTDQIVQPVAPFPNIRKPFEVVMLHNSDRDRYTFVPAAPEEHAPYYLLSRDQGQPTIYWKAGPFERMAEADDALRNNTYYEGMTLWHQRGTMTAVAPPATALGEPI